MCAFGRAGVFAWDAARQPLRRVRSQVFTWRPIQKNNNGSYRVRRLPVIQVSYVVSLCLDGSVAAHGHWDALQGASELRTSTKLFLVENVCGYTEAYRHCWIDTGWEDKGRKPNRTRVYANEPYSREGIAQGTRNPRPLFPMIDELWMGFEDMMDLCVESCKKVFLVHE